MTILAMQLLYKFPKNMLEDMTETQVQSSAPGFAPGMFQK